MIIQKKNYEDEPNLFELGSKKREEKVYLKETSREEAEEEDDYFDLIELEKNLGSVSKAVGEPPQNLKEIETEIHSMKEVKSGIFESLKKVLGLKANRQPPPAIVNREEDQEIKVRFF